MRLIYMYIPAFFSLFSVYFFIPFILFFGYVKQYHVLERGLAYLSICIIPEFIRHVYRNCVGYFLLSLLLHSIFDKMAFAFAVRQYGSCKIDIKKMSIYLK